jgi:hypothetical protein
MIRFVTGAAREVKNTAPGVRSSDEITLDARANGGQLSLRFAPMNAETARHWLLRLPAQRPDVLNYDGKGATAR